MAELEVERNRYEAEDQRIEDYYAGLLEEAVRDSQFPILNAAEEARIDAADSQLAEQQSTLGDLQESLAKIMVEARDADSKVKDAEIGGYRENRRDSQIDLLVKDKDQELGKLKEHFRSAADKIAAIQRIRTCWRIFKMRKRAFLMRHCTVESCPATEGCFPEHLD